MRLVACPILPLSSTNETKATTRIRSVYLGLCSHSVHSLLKLQRRKASRSIDPATRAACHLTLLATMDKNKRKLNWDKNNSPLAKHPRTTNPNKRSRAALINSIPRCDENLKKLSSPTFLVSSQRNLIFDKLNSPTVYSKKLFIKVEKLRNEKVLLVILVRADDLDELKRMLDGFDVTYSRENPTKRLDSSFSFMLTGIAPTTVKTNDQGERCGAIDKQSLEDAIHELNKFAGAIKVLRIYDRKTPFGAIISVENREDYEKLVKNRTLHIKTSTVVAFRHKPTPTCDRCALPGHHSDDCDLDSASCFCYKCGSGEHTASLCEKEHRTNRIEFTPCCVNCKERGEEQFRHFATSFYCPFRLDYIDHQFDLVERDEDGDENEY